MSRLGAIQTAVGTEVSGGITEAGLGTVTLGYDPVAFDQLPKDQFPHALILFEEEPPERLEFRQEIRRVSGSIIIAALDTTREKIDLAIEKIRDRLFNDTLGDTVDITTVAAGIAISSADDPIKYGTIDVSTEELF